MGSVVVGIQTERSSHYAKRKVQPWDLIDACQLNYHEGAAIKYIARNRDKNGDEDLIKALYEIQRELQNRGTVTVKLTITTKKA